MADPSRIYKKVYSQKKCAVKQATCHLMEITIGGMTMKKNSIDKSNHYYLFDEAPKTTARRLFKEVSMRHFFKKIILHVNFKSFLSTRTKRFSALTLKFAK